MPGPITCKTCGFLTIRERDENRAIEALQQWRENGQHTGNFQTKDAVWLCYLSSPAFPPRPPSTGKNDHEHYRAARQIEQPIECSLWMQYQPFMSPQEHRDMKLVARVEESQARFQREEIARRDQWRREDVADRDKQHSHNTTTRIISLASVGVALFMAAVAGITLWYSFNR